MTGHPDLPTPRRTLRAPYVWGVPFLPDGWGAMTAPPERHWRSYDTDPLPTAQEALQQPMRAFPSWFASPATAAARTAC
jgi:hypothetical protein